MLSPADAILPTTQLLARSQALRESQAEAAELNRKLRSMEHLLHLQEEELQAMRRVRGGA